MKKWQNGDFVRESIHYLGELTGSVTSDISPLGTMAH
jgi:hypothetical protein